MTDDAKPEQTALNDSGTSSTADAGLTRARSPAVHGWTYFVRDGDMIKIGSSIRPHKRVEAIQTGSPRTIELLAIVSQTVADEFETHQKFSHLRSRGEWFHADPELLDYIEQLKAVPRAALEPVPEIAALLPPPKSGVPDPVIRGLLMRRNRVGAVSPEGCVLSNIAGQTRFLNDPDPRPWVSHPMQTVKGMMARQTELLS